MIRKIGLISKFTTLQSSSQTIAIHILPNISRSKGNHTVECSQVIKYKKRNIFFKNHAENVPERLVPDLFFIFLKQLYMR